MIEKECFSSVFAVFFLECLPTTHIKSCLKILLFASQEVPVEDLKSFIVTPGHTYSLRNRAVQALASCTPETTCGEPQIGLDLIRGLTIFVLVVSWWF